MYTEAELHARMRYTVKKNDRGWVIAQILANGDLAIPQHDKEIFPKYGYHLYKHEALAKLKEVEKEEVIQHWQGILPFDKETTCVYTRKNNKTAATFYLVHNDVLVCLDEDIHSITNQPMVGKKPEKYIKVPSYIIEPSTYLFEMFKALDRPLNVKEI